MKLKDIELTDKNHFIAMEYYYLILNRTFLVIKTKGFLIGIEGNGLSLIHISEPTRPY